MERRTLKSRGRYWGGEGTNWTDTAGCDKITGRQVVQILSQEKAPCLQRREKKKKGRYLRERDQQFYHVQ